MLQNVNQKSCGMVLTFFQADKVIMERDSQKTSRCQMVRCTKRRCEERKHFAFFFTAPVFLV